MNYKYIIKNSDINENDTNEYIYYFYKNSYKDNINYLSNNMNSIKMMYIGNYMKSNSLYYLPYSICFIYINNYYTNNYYTKRIDKLPSTLKMICITYAKQMLINEIYNLPLLIKYILICYYSFQQCKHILATYIKITDIILHDTLQIDIIENSNISFNLHLYSDELYNKYLNLSIQN